MGFTIECNECKNSITIKTYEDKTRMVNGEMSIYVCTDRDWYDEITCHKCNNSISKTIK